jgi:glycosyltransferase involved in cell wall biosynthesis
MIWLDVTKTASVRHKSGLTRVTTRLREALGAAAREHRWPGRRAWTAEARQDDWYLTAEVFAPRERPNFEAFVQEHPVRLGAIFHDTIPLELPHVTWPKSVGRHPLYLSMLADFDRVVAVSNHSRDRLVSFWKWQGRKVRAQVEVLASGADFVAEEGGGAPLPAPPDPRARPQVLCVGILEPRKNQLFLLSVAETLWRQGLDFDLAFVGRVNPHFGRPIAQRIRRSRARYLGAVPDEQLAALYREATVCAVPTLAEGNGLPLLEALWCGTPGIASDLPPLRENSGAGCLLMPPGDEAAWANALREILASPAARQSLRDQAAARRPGLPRWSDTARALQSFLSA